MATIFLANTLIDGTGHEPIQKAFLAFQDDRITAVGPASQVKIDQENDEVIDTGNGVLMPGLIDSHCHLFYLIGGATKPQSLWGPADTIRLIKEGLESAKWWLSQGVTTVRDVGTAENYDLGLRDLIAQGKVVGPRIFGAGQPIAMLGRALFHGMGLEINSADEARRATRQQLRAGVDIIKLFASAGMGGGHQGSLFWTSGWEQLTVEEMQAAAFEAHKAGRTVAAHAIGAQSIKNAVKAGVDTVEHCTNLDEEGLEMIKARNVIVVPTLAVGELLAEKGKQLGHPQRMEDYARAGVEAGRKSVQMAHQARVKIAAGTDPNHLERMLDECICLHKAGLSPMEVIIAATRTGAEAVRAQDRLGTLETGKIADFIVLDSNPLEDLNALDHVSWVIKDGKIYKSPNGFIESENPVMDSRIT